MNDSNTAELTIGARLATTAVAGSAAYGAAGLTSLFIGPIAAWSEVFGIMAVFVTIYVPGVFAGRRMLRRFATPQPPKVESRVGV